VQKIKTIIKVWLPFAVVITACCALAYASVQQAYRQGADDPQMQMAEDAAYVLDHGAAIEDYWSTDEVEMSRSLAPFIIIYSAEGDPVGGSGRLNGGLPEVPIGVLDFARQNGQNRVTWEPAEGVRIASVIVPYSDGFVLAGRSLREVEVREAQVSMFAGSTWVLALSAAFVTIAFGEFALRERK
jgi:hypothetical protein